MPGHYWSFPYPSQRMPVLADNVVATSQPLAAQAGLEMLRRGGNAVDAAVAAAAALTVVEPTGNGLGSDAFAQVWDGRRLHGLNASGRAPAGVDTERLLALDAMPTHGWDAVTVPGAPAAWAALTSAFGTLGLDELVEPAARYAEHGWPVGPVTATAWAQAPAAYRGFEAFAHAFLPGGRAPAPGQRFALPEQAATLRAIGRTAAADFYQGETAERIAAAADAAGAALDGADLAAHTVDWVQPVTRAAFGLELSELPPNGQGIAALAALGALEHTDAALLAVDEPTSIHLQAEAMKAALADAYAELGDPASMRLTVDDLLAPSRLAAHAAAIDPEAASALGQGAQPRGGTVYLAAADAEGLMVSFIQSNYLGFGSGVVVPGTGVALQNRGACFSTTPGHPNAIGPAKRPFHTIIPAFTSRDGQPLVAFGVMGGHLQPQAHTQMLLRLAIGGENPQAAADAPRWRVDDDGSIALEAGWPPSVAEGLRARGHTVVEAPPGRSEAMLGFGGAQLVERRPGGWLAASDPRKDGQAVGY